MTVFASTPRASVSTRVTPLFRKASSRSRCSNVVKSNSVLLKVSVLGKKVISVPVARPSRPDPSGHAGAGPISASGASGTPSRKRMNHSEPPRKIRISSLDDRPLTTETPDTVQSARDLVRVLVEFAAGMKVGHDYLGGRHPFLVVDADRDAAAVVGDGARAVGVQGHGNGVAIAGQRLVDRVVDDLVDHVVQAGAVIGVADIHARPLAHGVEPAQHLDRLLIVGCVFAVGMGGAIAVRRCARSPRHERPWASIGETESEADVFAMSSGFGLFRGQGGGLKGSLGHGAVVHGQEPGSAAQRREERRDRCR